MRRVLAALALVLLPSAAGAETVAALVEERVRAEAAAAPGGSWRVTAHPPLEGVSHLVRFWIDPRTGRYLADALLETGEVRRVGGVALAVAAVPVPVRRLAPGEIVAAADLTEVEMPLARLGAFAVTARDALVGRQVRRMLAPGRPVMAQSVMAPLAVTRGQRVTIRLEADGLSLRAPGRALGDAAAGDAVKAVNLVTSRSIMGTAAADGTVEVLR